MRYKRSFHCSLNVIRLLLATTALAAAPLALAGAVQASKSQLWIFEDHRALIGSGDAKRIKTLNEIKALGANMLRVEVKWNEVAPGTESTTRPAFDATDPAQYPGFAPYDDLIRRASTMGFKVLVTITGDAPRWASANGAPLGPERGNFKPSASEYGKFAAAVAKRYSGGYAGLPAAQFFSIWNEPNHRNFLKPSSEAPMIYRGLVDAGVPAIRANAPGAKVLVGETAPVGRAPKAIGPKRFIREWLCLGSSFRALRGRAAAADGCSNFKKIDADGFAHHPYGPTERVPKKADIINMLAIRQLGSLLDKAARAGRLPAGLPIYNTEFGLQSNPPDTFVSTSPTRQAKLINEKEEFSYRYPRLKTYSQYLMFDDPPRPGPAVEKWSGFQTGLRFSRGRKKPAFDAYRLPIVVHKRGRGVSIWGLVRPSSGTRFAQLQRKHGSRFVNDDGLISTDSLGYFTIRRPALGNYRFKGFDQGHHALGLSRVASPGP